MLTLVDLATGTNGDNTVDQAEIDQLQDENAKLKATLDEIQRTIEPFLEKKKPSQPRTFEQQLLHDVRNILNELCLLRALVPGDEGEK